MIAVKARMPGACVECMCFDDGRTRCLALKKDLEGLNYWEKRRPECPLMNLDATNHADVYCYMEDCKHYADTFAQGCNRFISGAKNTIEINEDGMCEHMKRHGEQEYDGY